MHKQSKHTPNAADFPTEEHYRQYLDWQRSQRVQKREAVIEVISGIGLVALLAFAVKVWFVMEGFTIKW